ncbi:MAG: hypothetical protein LBN00_11570 [Oscillospiraceae bacterium]|jgi:hypothetical protein|nr:hypothetical protein [Oscillospiraceae bacterium]
MQNLDIFVIKYAPIEGKVRFVVIKGSGISADIADSEQLKDYENKDGLFSLEGQHGIVFNYISENFDGKSEIILKVEVLQLDYDRRRVEFERFEENVKKFNKTSETKVTLEIDVNKSAPKQEVEVLATEIQSNQPAADSTTAEPKPTLKVAVVGKISSGKTVLIEGLTEYNNSACESSLLSYGATKYSDFNNNIEWFEIAGIEFGKENVIRAREVLDKLISDNGVSVVLYCFSAQTGKIEDIERDFIVDVKQKHPDIIVCAVVTACVEEITSRIFADKVSKSTKQTKAFTVLAKEMRTNAGYLQPFGLDELIKNIFGD